MSRTPLLVLALLLPSAAATAAPVQLMAPRIAEPLQVVLARAFDRALLGPPRAALDEVIVWQRGFRDLLHGARARLAALAEHGETRIPDLTVLTTEPIANTESSGFGWRDDPFRHHRKFHSGADFRGKPGTPVLAAGDGVVTFSGRQGGYGNVVYVDHGGGVVTRYAHLRRILTKKHAAITAGQLLGQVGATGRVTGPHLHFEVRLDGRPVDPATAMSVAQLARESHEIGRIAAYALAPEIQSAHASRIDPPRQKAQARVKAKGSRDSRPARSGHARHVRPQS